jgi:hypothetical protein
VIARLWGLHRQVVNEPQQVRRESGRDLFQQGIAEGAEVVGYRCCKGFICMTRSWVA